MKLPNVSRTPRVWSDDELTIEAKKALDEFVERRLAEPSTRYVEHVEARRTAITRLFKALSGINSADPDPAIVRAIILDGEMFAALRYVAGPPISEDDLGVLITRSTRRPTKTDFRQNDALTQQVLKLICRVADPYRFPWIAARRPPRSSELRDAIRATMTLHAAQTLQTERRGYGKIIEKRLEHRLTELEFKKITPRNGGNIDAPLHYPVFPEFYTVCNVYTRQIDLLIGLPDRRLIAVEAKDSSSAINSKKRVLNDTGAKAEQFARSAGKTILTVGLLSGVFTIPDLKSAQDKGLYLVWAHDLDGFVEWIKSQT